MAFALDTNHPLYPFIRHAIGVDPVSKEIVDLKGVIGFTKNRDYTNSTTNTAWGYPAKTHRNGATEGSLLMSPKMGLRSVNSTVFMALGNTTPITNWPNDANTILDADVRGNILVTLDGKLGMTDSAESQTVPHILSTSNVGAKTLYTAAITVSGSDATGGTHRLYVDGVLEATGAPRRVGEGSYVESLIRDYGAIGYSPGGFSSGKADVYWIIVFDKALSDAEIASLHTSVGALNTIGLLEGGAAQLPTVTAVVIDQGATATVSGFASTTFTATVQGTNSPSQAVTWSTTAGTINAATGEFTAPFATSVSQTVTVTATSVDDTGKSGSITVTVPAAGTVEQAVVTGISITPKHPEVAGGAKAQFVTLVSGTGNPSQGVTWTVSGGSMNSALAEWTAPAAQGTAQTYTITATSQANPTFSASAVVTVPAVAAAGQFLTDRMTNISDQPLANVSVHWSWFPNGRIGSLTGITPVEGSGTLDALGQLLVTGLPAGAGLLVFAHRNASALTDEPAYQAGVVA